MARIYTRTMANYFQKNNINTWRYVKRGLNCWTKSNSDFECKVECPYNERKTECDCHTQVCKDAIEYINELEATLADVVPKSEVEALEKEVERLQNIINSYALQYGTVTDQHEVIEKAQTEAAREIFADLENLFGVATEATVLSEVFETPNYKRFKKKYTEDKS